MHLKRLLVRGCLGFGVLDLVSKVEATWSRRSGLVRDNTSSDQVRWIAIYRFLNGGWTICEISVIRK